MPRLRRMTRERATI
ncbi:hypothetical protein [Caulobacter sp. FWC2]|nr:hypothetical protein [Caulobacter sp. FWC2]